MAEAAAAYIAEALWVANFAEAAIVVLNYGAAIIQAAAFVASVYTMRENQRRAENRAKEAYNDSLRDRYIMFRATAEPRRIVLGRQRVSGPLAYIGSYGTNKENLVYAAIMAAEEIDGYEEFYFDDELLSVDGSGVVTGQQARELFSMSATTASFTLQETPEDGTVSASIDYGSSQAALTIVSVVGNVVSVSGASGAIGSVTVRFRPINSPWVTGAFEPVSLPINIVAGTGVVSVAGYEDLTGIQIISGTNVPDTELPNAVVNIIGPGVATYNSSASTITVTAVIDPDTGAPITDTWRVGFTAIRRDRLCRITTYTGAAGQTADPDLLAAAPGLWTSAHVMTNLAYVVVTAKFNQKAFPGGLMSISANVRGSKVIDQRTGVRAFSANPAILTRHIAYHPFFGRQPLGVVNDAMCSAAANACDASVTYVINGLNVARPKYEAGLVAKNGVRAKDIIDDLVAAMAGRWVYSEGEIVMRAGEALTVTQTLDETWLTDAQDIEIQLGNNRADMVNILTGTFADSTRSYNEMPFVPVRSAAYIAEDGAELSQDIRLNAITLNAQCQQVAASMLRDMRQDTRITLSCNMRAFRTQVLDVINVNLSRFGFVNLRAEVIDRAFTLDGGVQLTLKKQDANAWNMGLSFTEPVPSNSAFRNPNDLPTVSGMTVSAGLADAMQQSDGVVTPRIKVSWTPTTDRYVTFGGGVEIRCGDATRPFTEWTSTFVVDGASSVYLTGQRQGLVHGVQARYFTQATKGEWNVTKWIQVLTSLFTRVKATQVIKTPLVSNSFGPHTQPFSNGSGHDLCSTTATNTSDKPWEVEISFQAIRTINMSAPAARTGGGTAAAFLLNVVSSTSGSVGPSDYGVLAQPSVMQVDLGATSAQHQETQLFHYVLAPGETLTVKARAYLNHFDSSATATLLTRDALLRLTVIKM